MCLHAWEEVASGHVELAQSDILCKYSEHGQLLLSCKLYIPVKSIEEEECFFWSELVGKAKLLANARAYTLYTFEASVY